MGPRPAAAGREPQAAAPSGEAKAFPSTMEGRQMTDPKDTPPRQHVEFTEDEWTSINHIARWYRELCAAKGIEPPANDLRCALAVAQDVFMARVAIEVAKQQADDDDDDGPPTGGLPH